MRSGDVDLDGLLRALADLGAPTAFTGGCIAAQDHGFDPHGSNRVLRFQMWERALAARTPLEELFYAADEVPAELTRLRAAAGELAALPQVTAADTGPAALLGALGDDTADAVLVNVGNCHTICAVALEGRLAGIYEDHTNRLDGPTLETYVRRFLAGALPGDEVRQAGGHGAALGGPVPAGLPVLVTGPQRELLDRQLAAGELPGAVRRRDDDRPGRPHPRPSPPLRRLRTSENPTPLCTLRADRVPALVQRRPLERQPRAGADAASSSRAAAACRRPRRGRARTPGGRSARRAWRCRG